MEYGYFHPSRGYWQTTGQPSADILATYPEGTSQIPLKPGAGTEWDGAAWVAVSPPQPTDADLLARIDAEADALIGSVIGNRGHEYEAAEAGAIAYQAAGFTGSVPPMVQVWADVEGQTAQWAAEDILTQAAAWRGASLAIRQARLTAKKGVRTGNAASALTVWAGFLVSMRSALGVS